MRTLLRSASLVSGIGTRLRPPRVLLVSRETRKQRGVVGVRVLRAAHARACCLHGHEQKYADRLRATRRLFPSSRSPATSGRGGGAAAAAAAAVAAAAAASWRSVRRRCARSLASRLVFCRWQATHSTCMFSTVHSPPPSKTAVLWSACQALPAMCGASSSREASLGSAAIAGAIHDAVQRDGVRRGQHATAGLALQLL